MANGKGQKNRNFDASQIMVMSSLILPIMNPQIVRSGLRVGIYYRRAAWGANPDEQWTVDIARCTEYATQLGYALVGVYGDKGCAGTLINPGLARLLQDINAGLLDVIVVDRLERLGRSKDVLAYCNQAFKHGGVYIDLVE